MFSVSSSMSMSMSSSTADLVRGPAKQCGLAWGARFSRLHGESELSQHRDSAAPAPLEITRGKAVAAGELVRGSEDRLGRVRPSLPDQVVGRGRREAVLGEERLRAQPVVLL